MSCSKDDDNPVQESSIQGAWKSEQLSLGYSDGYYIWYYYFTAKNEVFNVTEWYDMTTGKKYVEDVYEGTWSCDENKITMVWPTSEDWVIDIVSLKKNELILKETYFDYGDYDSTAVPVVPIEVKYNRCDPEIVMSYFYK